MEQKIVTVQLTTDSHTPSGKTADIIIDADKAHLVGGNALFHSAPQDKGMFIVRNHEGYYLQREGKTGIGVSLPSYLFGAIYMHRRDKDVKDDFSREAFKDRGKPAIINLLKTPDSFKAVKSLFVEEHREYIASMKSKAIEPTKVTKPTGNVSTLVNSMLESKRLASEAPSGTKLECPNCGDAFTKKHSKTIFCSSHSRPGADGKRCKDSFNQRLYGLQKKEDKPTVVAKPAVKVEQKPAPVVVAKPKKSKPAKAQIVIDNSSGLRLTTKKGTQMFVDSSTLIQLNAKQLKAIIRS